MKYLLIVDTELYATVDDHNYDRLSVYRWYGKSRNIHRYGCTNGERFIVSLAAEVKQNIGQQYDHIDRNYLNNLEENLRECTQQQNSFNTSKILFCRSEYKGVTWTRKNRKWRAKIRKDAIHIHIGYFKEEKAAALAYNQRAKELFGEFAYQNVIC